MLLKITREEAVLEISRVKQCKKRLHKQSP